MNTGISQFVRLMKEVSEFRIRVGIADGRCDKRLPVIGNQRVLMAGAHVGVPVAHRYIHGCEILAFEKIFLPVVAAGHDLARGGVVLGCKHNLLLIVDEVRKGIVNRYVSG